MMCQVLQVSASGYYAWRQMPEGLRSQANRALLEKIVHIHQHSRETYGYPRVHAELQAAGDRCGRHRVARLMRLAGLKTKQKRLWERSGRGRTFEHIEAHKLERDFASPVPDKKWVSDITQFPTAEGWLYLAAVMDLYSRRIVGWAMDKRPTQQLVTDALKMALWRRGSVKGLLVHSDQGMQYRTGNYHRLLRTYDIECSMSRKGNCLDNAPMESFFHTLKKEHSHHVRFRTRAEARLSLFEWIEVFYNRQRRHSYLDYMTPDEYERYTVATNP
jgi:transposase InsO family protein